MSLVKFLSTRGLLFSSLTFFLVHVPDAIFFAEFSVIPGLTEGLLGLIVFGMLYSVAYRLTNSFIFPMAMHFSANLTFVTWTLIV